MESVKRAMKAKPEDIGEDNLEDSDALSFFLNVVIPAVEPKVNKRWTNEMTHLEFFGNSYPYEFALGMMLMEHYSGTDNVLHNQGMLDENGLLRQKDDVLKPERKKRKKMETSKVIIDVENSYYQSLHEIQEMMLDPHFKVRMEAWDRKLCSNRCTPRESNTTIANRENTVPRASQQQQNQRLSAGFLSKMFNSITPGSESSPGSTGESSALLTQSPPIPVLVDTATNVQSI